MVANRRHTQLEGFSGINVTPLMDLTFLLLIVFMLTAPMLEYTVDVSPPRLDAEEIDDPDNILITLDATGRLQYRDRQVSLGELAGILEETAKAAPGKNVLIRADESRPYGEVVDIMRTVRRQGLTRIALVTRSEEAGD